ncbi:MAG: HNH endonuclease [Bosea sp.]|uniref:HNH endonuclease signature motif containing protein n=1 Tax=unclassified Bosea (in: a-proteobacteria) TaxID=2653178 RepID=UPI000AF14858|nr:MULTISPECIES: HNH endonuclease signature motif containing protein [unclassified Bosea (in: a-proteobacteria)]MBN9459005.1 HNH endonuclease [Bosea sp. (in: a-proteobacteria)]
MKRRVIPYSDEEMAWLEATRMMVISDYHSGFVTAFDRPDVRMEHLHALRKRKGWKVGRAGGRYAGRLRLFNAEEVAWLRANATLPHEEYYRGFRAAFGREDVSPAQVRAARKRQRWKTGRTGRFEKGQAPRNKGKRCAPGTGGLHPNAVRTHFKKGQRPHTYRGPGHERIDEQDGYVILIVEERNPWTGAATRQVHKHRWLWEKANGPLPEGFVLKCLDGDKTNTDPSNWEAVPRAVLARLNGGRHKTFLAFDDAPAELKPTLLARAKLQHKLSTLKRRTEKESQR